MNPKNRKGEREKGRKGERLLALLLTISPFPPFTPAAFAAEAPPLPVPTVTRTIRLECPRWSRVEVQSSTNLLHWTRVLELRAAPGSRLTNSEIELPIARRGATFFRLKKLD